MAGNPTNPPGEKKTSPWVKVFECPSCGAGVTIRAVGMTITAVCGSCASIIDTSNDNYKVLEKASKTGLRVQVINLGHRGKLHGTVWEAIGYMERQDSSGVYTWSEYLLFNPLKGFRWLTEFDGHWNYIITTKTKPKTSSSHLSGGSYGREYARYLDKFYYLFHRGSAKVSYVIGEFYWQVSKGERVHVEDYVAPPEVLSCEKSDSEEIWSLGEYISADDVKAAFQIVKPMPMQFGVAPNQPCTSGGADKECSKLWFKMLMTLCALQFVFMIISKDELSYQGQFSTSTASTEKVIVTPQFELKHGTKNIKIKLSSPVQNNWLEIQGDLVNDENGDTIEFEQGVEYYSGYDSDGGWTEGSQSGSIVISSVPSGKYHLNLEPSNGQPYDLAFEITIKRDVTTWSNFMWALILISILPIILWWRSWRFELSRWSQSDFSPHFLHQKSDYE